jgi:hypothetical protein
MAKENRGKMGWFNDFLMRSLWQDIEVVESTLSRLQRVGDELAAAIGPRSCGIACALSRRKSFIGS